MFRTFGSQHSLQLALAAQLASYPPSASSPCKKKKKNLRAFLLRDASEQRLVSKKKKLELHFWSALTNFSSFSQSPSSSLALNVERQCREGGRGSSPVMNHSSFLGFKTEPVFKCFNELAEWLALANN